MGLVGHQAGAGVPVLVGPGHERAATERDLRDYFRLGAKESPPRVAELVEEGQLLPIAVEGWRQPAYLWHEARVPRAIDARALVGPFDPPVLERPRALRPFGPRA